MNQSDLKPASAFAMRLGVKAIIFGPPGSAKTPLIQTCPRPVLLATEPGLLSMRNSKVPTWIAPTKTLIDDFFKWFEHSAENKNFDTLAIDSASGMCDIALNESKKAHGLGQYGDMADYVLPYLQRLYWMPQKHMYIICREELTVDGKRRPSFPGQQLNRDVPHLYDCILRLAKTQVPNEGEVLAFQCNGSYDIVARNRVSTLNTFEPPNFGDLVRKAML
jgi:hypothetical protein